jgi:Uma2 family endonuclease
MALSYERETRASLLGRLVELLTLEVGTPIKAAGSTTLRRPDMDRGLEPDRCFYLRHAANVRGRREIDLSRDPPPDLAIDADVKVGWVERLATYGALGVPEVWRYDGQAVRVYRRRSDGTYDVDQGSLAFPFLPVAELGRFVREGQHSDDTAVAQAFLAWLREEVVPTRPRKREKKA